MKENDIDDLILTYGKLPKAYIEMLQLIGSGTTAPFWKGQCFFKRDIPFLNSWAKAAPICGYHDNQGVDSR